MVTIISGERDPKKSGPKWARKEVEMMFDRIQYLRFCVQYVAICWTSASGRGT